MLFITEAIKRAGSTDTERIIDALESGMELDTGVGKIKLLKYSHRVVVPIFVGVTRMTSQHPFATFTDLKVYTGEKVMISEDEVRKIRGQ